MGTQQALATKWHEVRAQLKEKWNKLSDEDLRNFDGNVDQLVSRIQRKTGESREAIGRFLDQISEQGAQMVDEVHEGVSSGLDQASDAAEQGYEALRQGYAEAEKVVQERPGQALAVAFGLGMLAGVGAVLLLRDRPSESTMSRGRSATERFGKQILDALASVVPNRS